jgi:hypothetical protein
MKTDARKQADEAWERFLPYAWTRESLDRLQAAVLAEIIAYREDPPARPIGYLFGHLYPKRDEDLQAEHEVASERAEREIMDQTAPAPADEPYIMYDEPAEDGSHTVAPSEPESGEARPEPMDEHQMAHLIGVGCEDDVPHDDLCDAFLNLYARLQPRTVSREEVIEAYRYAGGGKNDIAPFAEVVAARLNQHLGLTIQPEED